MRCRARQLGAPVTLRGGLAPTLFTVGILAALIVLAIAAAVFLPSSPVHVPTHVYE